MEGERVKRKRRGGGTTGDATPGAERDAGAGTEGSAGAGRDAGASSIARGYAGAERRNRQAREALQPLAEGERPTVVTIGAVVSGLIAASILIAYLAGTKVNGATPKLTQVLAPALIMGVMSWGMWRARYWAVLGFQLVLVFLIFSAFFGLVAQAASPLQFLATLGLLAVSGAFFFFMVKAMARIQMPTRPPRE